VRGVWRGIVDFVVGDDIWIAVAVLVLLAATAALVRWGGEAWWLLPVGVPTALFVSLLRARRSVERETHETPL
jgi:hypothetical protein